MKISNFLDLGFNYVEKKVGDDRDIIGASIDTRTLEQGNVFFAIKGESVDGNEFIDVAIKKGASLIFTDDKQSYSKYDFNIVLVKNILETIYEIGRIRFNNFDKKKIVITGSFGKTTTKEILRDILSERFKVYATKGNFNNKLGVSLTGVALDDEADLAIIEIGTSAKGEIAELAEIIKPSIAVVTTIGHAHIGYFGSFDDIVDEKLSIAKWLKDGLLFIPSKFKSYINRSADVYKLVTFGNDGDSDIRLNDMKFVTNGILFSVQNFTGSFFLNYCYEHVVYNTLPLIFIAHMLGLSREQIEVGLAKSKPFKSRGCITKVGELEILDDCYNAGLESMLHAIYSLERFSEKKQTVILGEIAEIDGFEDEIYKKIIDEANRLSSIDFILVGKNYMSYKGAENIRVFPDKFSATDTIKAIDSGVVLVKASHSYGFDEVVRLLKGEK